MNDLLQTRSLLAILTWLGTIAFIIKGFVIPDAWWLAMGAINTFYFADVAVKNAIKAFKGDK